MQLSVLVLRVLITVHPCVNASYSAPEVSWEAEIALKLQYISFAHHQVVLQCCVPFWWAHPSAPFEGFTLQSQCFEGMKGVGDQKKCAPCKPLLRHFAKKINVAPSLQKVSKVPVEILHYEVPFRSGVILFGTQHESNFQTFSHTLPCLSLVG